MTVENWIEKIINTEQPAENIIAYYFGLFETPDGYNIYLIGSSEYDAEDDDWACNCDFEPKDKYLTLSEEFKKLEWNVVQDTIVNLLKDVVKTDLFKNSFLAKANAIAVGFDEGDLTLIK